MAHIAIESGDGNGTPAGIRLSWAAVMAIIAFLGLFVTIANGIRTSDVRLLQTEIGAARAETAIVDKARIEDKRTLEARLDRIQSGIESIRQWQIEQGKAR